LIGLLITRYKERKKNTRQSDKVNHINQKIKNGEIRYTFGLAIRLFRLFDLNKRSSSLFLSSICIAICIALRWSVIPMIRVHKDGDGY